MKRKSKSNVRKEKAESEVMEKYRTSDSDKISEQKQLKESVVESARSQAVSEVSRTDVTVDVNTRASEKRITTFNETDSAELSDAVAPVDLNGATRSPTTNEQEQPPQIPDIDDQFTVADIYNDIRDVECDQTEHGEANWDRKLGGIHNDCLLHACCCCIIAELVTVSGENLHSAFVSERQRTGKIFIRILTCTYVQVSRYIQRHKRR